MASGGRAWEGRWEPAPEAAPAMAPFWLGNGLEGWARTKEKRADAVGVGEQEIAESARPSRADGVRIAAGRVARAAFGREDNFCKSSASASRAGGTFSAM